MRAELEKSGAQPAIPLDAATPTSATMALVQLDAERAFLHCTGANATFEIGDFDASLLDGADLLHIRASIVSPRIYPLKMDVTSSAS